jgi:hypothetical protein
MDRVPLVTEDVLGTGQAVPEESVFEVRRSGDIGVRPSGWCGEGGDLAMSGCGRLNHWPECRISLGVWQQEPLRSPSRGGIPRTRRRDRRYLHEAYGSVTPGCAEGGPILPAGAIA